MFERNINEADRPANLDDIEQQLSRLDDLYTGYFYNVVDILGRFKNRMTLFAILQGFEIFLIGLFAIIYIVNG
jgi:hypothetical protein